MIKKLFGLTLLIVFLIGCKPEVQLKTVKIGDFNWYTEQNSIEDIGKIAKKENKNILAVFSALWCGPCQATKHGTFETPEFKEVADKVILLYVEQTEKKGEELCKKYNIKSYPTFKILNYKGEVVDIANLPNRDVKSFSNWIDNVKKGNTLFTAEQAYKKHPNDLKSALNYVEKLPWDRAEKAISILEKVIGEKPNCEDKLVLKAIETLFNAVINKQYNIERKEDVDKFIKKWDGIFMGNYKDCIERSNSKPDIFLRWHRVMGRWDKIIARYENKLSKKSISETFPSGLPDTRIAMYAYMRANKPEKVKEIYKNYIKWEKKNIDLNTRIISIYYLDFSRDIANIYFKEKNIQGCQSVLDNMFSTFNKLDVANKLDKNNKMYSLMAMESLVFRYEYGFEKLITILDKEIKSLKGLEKAKFLGTKAKILAKSGKKKEAKAIYEKLGTDQKLLSSMKEKKKQHF